MAGKLLHRNWLAFWLLRLIIESGGTANDI